VRVKSESQNRNLILYLPHMVQISTYVTNFSVLRNNAHDKYEIYVFVKPCGLEMTKIC